MEVLTVLLKIMIADDEEILRKELAKKISEIKDIEIIYTAGNGLELIKAIKKMKPHIIITDIAMPGMSGIDVIRKIRNELSSTEIIFITSYEEYIKQAVELYAVDFIEKPIDYERLCETILRIKKRFADNNKLIEFRIDKGSKYIRLNDLYFIEAMKKKTRIVTEKEDFISNYSLRETEELIKDDFLFKSSRSYLINLKNIKEIKNISRTSFEINFINTKFKAYLSKKNYDEFRIKLKKINLKG